jgi:hypothetical protein
LGQRGWSFGVGYALVPPAFYAVDAVLHLRALMVFFPFVLRVALMGVVAATIIVIELNQHRLRVQAPIGE